MAKEEEAATGTSGLTSLENLISIRQRVQGPLDLLEADIIHGSQPLEDTCGEGFDLGAWQSISTLLLA